jgi:hypothetical protein
MNPRYVGRGFDHHGFIAQLEPGGHIYRGGIRREPEGLGVHELFEQHVRWYWQARASSRPCLRALHAMQIGMPFERKPSVARCKIEVVIDLLGGLRVWNTIYGRQCPDGGFQPVGRRDTLGDLGVVIFILGLLAHRTSLHRLP